MRRLLAQIQLKSGSVSSVLSVFLHRYFPLPSGKQPIIKAVAYNSLGVSWTMLANNAKEGFSCPVLGVA